MSGYTAETETNSEEPDMELISRLAQADCRVVAEGRFRTPEQAAEALRRGADASLVGADAWAEPLGQVTRTHFP